MRICFVRAVKTWANCSISAVSTANPPFPVPRIQTFSAVPVKSPAAQRGCAGTTSAAGSAMGRTTSQGGIGGCRAVVGR